MRKKALVILKRFASRAAAIRFSSDVERLYFIHSISNQKSVPDEKDPQDLADRASSAANLLKYRSCTLIIFDIITKNKYFFF